MIRLLLLAIVLQLTFSSCAQVRKCSNVLKPEVDDTFYWEGDYEFKYKDSSKRVVDLVFEDGFKGDSVSIVLSNKVVWSANLTSKRGVSDKYYTLDYEKYTEAPLVSVFMNSGKCISFYPIEGKRIIFIGYPGGWRLETSNTMRVYR